MASRRQFVHVTPHIYKLDVFIAGAPAGIFLVRDAAGWILIDCGPRATGKLVIDAAEALTNESPTCIVITHGHLDHAGALPEMVERWKIPVYAHSEEVPFITGPRRYRDIRPAPLFYRLISRFLSPPPSGVPIARTLTDGEMLGGLQVIHAPGHTPGQIALWHHADRAIIAADTFRFKLAGALPVMTPDIHEARRSMHKIASLDFDHLLTSHNRPLLHWNRRF